MTLQVKKSTHPLTKEKKNMVYINGERENKMEMELRNVAPSPMTIV